MRRLCVVFAVAVFLSVPSSVLADGPGAPDAGGQPASCGLAGTQALQFTVEGVFELSEFQGQMFSYQRFLTDTRAIRVAGGLFLDLDLEDLDVEYYGGDYTGTAETSYWNHKVTLKAQMQFYSGDGPLRFFWGAGPKVSYTDYHNEDVSYSTHDDELNFTYYTLDLDIWEVGLQGFAGVEWFINNMFSLHAEYAVTGAYEFEDRTEQRVYSEGPEYDRLVTTATRSPQFNSDGVRFGLSAHF